MPTYEYICSDCKTKYDIFHKTKEIDEDVICPSCGSVHHRKVMSVTAMSMGSGTSSRYDTPACDSGTCCGGSCGVN